MRRILILALMAAFVPGVDAQVVTLGMSGWTGLGALSTGRMWTAVPRAAAATAPSPAPVLSFALPRDQSTVSGAIVVLASATGATVRGVVSFYVDDTLAASIASSPYLFAWDTSSVANGSHTLAAVTRLPDGTASRASLQVTVQNAAGGPSWSIGLPIATGGAITLGDFASVPVQVSLASATARNGTLTIAAESTSDPVAEMRKRADERARGLLRVGSGAQVSFIPTAAVGAQALGIASAPSAQSAVIKLAYDPAKAPAGTVVNAYVWDGGAQAWQALPTASLDAAGSAVAVNAVIGAPSTYAVFASAAPQTLGPGTLGSVFAYPNPARHGRATIHVESPAVDSLELRIYSLGGTLVHRATLGGAPGVGAGGAQAYEYAWDTSGVASGAYIYTVETRSAGQTSRASGKLAVMR